LYQINLQDPSAGIYHINVSIALKSAHLSNTPFNQNRVAQWLIRYPKWSAKLALNELKYWLKYRKGDWFKAVGSYNGGFHWNRGYARAITNKVRFLKTKITF